MTSKPKEAGAFAETLLPPPDQLALLEAAFAPSEAFPAAFERWSALAGENPSRESYALLQLISPRVSEFGIESPLGSLCQQQSRLVWARSALIRKRLPAMLQPVLAMGVAPVILKGPALQAYYAAPQMRAMGDLDILVPRERFGDVIAAYGHADWRAPDFAQPGKVDPRFIHAIGMMNDAEDRVDIHVHPIHHWITWGTAETLFLKAAIPFDVEGLSVRTLCREHHILLVIMHALAAAKANGRWIADTVALLSDGQTDWERLVADAETLRIAPVVADALAIVGQILPGLPEEPIARLSKIPIAPELTAFNRALYDRSLSARTALHWRTVRIGAASNGLEAVSLLPAYLRFSLARRGGLFHAID